MQGCLPDMIPRHKEAVLRSTVKETWYSSNRRVIWSSLSITDKL